MSIIDRDTDQVLSRFINGAEDAIGRHNIDERMFSCRLMLPLVKQRFHLKKITIPEGMARDANGAADIASIEAAIRTGNLNAGGQRYLKDWKIRVAWGKPRKWCLVRFHNNQIMARAHSAGGTTVEERINRDLKPGEQH